MKHEEIEAYIKSRDLDVMQYQLVIDAIYYTEKTIIEKACKWLDDNLYTTCDVFNNTGVDSVDGYTVEKLIEEFKKAMEE